MAYKRDITDECNVPSCQSRAAYAVFNRKNAEMGTFCKRHADARVRDLKREEEKADVVEPQRRAKFP